MRLMHEVQSCYDNKIRHCMEVLEFVGCSRLGVHVFVHKDI